MTRIVNLLLILLNGLLILGLFYFYSINNAGPDNLRGPDADNNGIRDDVQEIIDGRLTTGSKDDLYLYAQVVQIMATEPEGVKAKIGNYRAVYAGHRCVGDFNSKSIEEATANTAARKVAYRKSESNLGSASVSLLDQAAACEQFHKAFEFINQSQNLSIWTKI